MGVPKFYRWLSERYPKITQRQAFLPSKELCEEYYDGKAPPPPLEEPDPIALCQLSPEIDRLYIDLNGVIHGCSHNNGDATGVTEQDIFTNVCYYLERVIADMVKPQELVYLAIDGVAPRAKLNQQRSRRYRGGDDETELSIYDEYNSTTKDGSTRTGENGRPRLTGKYEQNEEENNASEENFHSSNITPGTQFFQRLVSHLEHFLHHKMHSDPKWKHLTVILSGPNTPGEGEHKIMEFMRSERAKSTYNPNLRHCIMGQDADLMLLGLVTHEPNLCLLRERVIFQTEKRQLYAEEGLDVYLHNCHFEWLHLSVLRDYLMYEFETPPAVPTSKYDLERTIDDFVFLTFFVGNDFLPHMPALDIGDEAFDLLFYVYKKQRKRWQKQQRESKKNNSSGSDDPYLTNAGEIVCGRRLQQFCAHLGSHEMAYYDNKRASHDSDLKKMRQQDSKMGIESTIPSDDLLEKKEEDSRQKYREMLSSLDPLQVSTTEKFRPVLTNDAPLPQLFQQEDDDELEKGFLAKMGSLLQGSISEVGKNDSESTPKLSYESVDDQDLKGRYYYDKFQFTPFDAEKHSDLRKSYLQGLVWTLHYYYKGCVSWEWYYPYHYGPMLSDLVNLENHLKEMSFEKGRPLQPFQQLVGCLPPSSAHLLPKPFQWLMTSENSPISDFFPKSFMIDMNGKRWPWEAVVLLPFIDSKRLISAVDDLVPASMLSKVERERNQTKPAMVFKHDASQSTSLEHLEDYPQIFHGLEVCHAKVAPINATEWDHSNAGSPMRNSKEKRPPVPGFPSLTSVPIQSLWRRRNGTNVHGLRSRFRTAVLDTSDEILPEFPDLEVLAPKFIGTSVYINYPYLQEAFVTAISDNSQEIRGDAPPKPWNANESEVWKHTMNALTKSLELGQALPGTGGWRLPQSKLLLSVRPLQSISTINHQEAKVYAKFEIQVPFLAAMWSPPTTDPRLETLAALEKDPYFFGAKQLTKKKKKKRRKQKGPLLPESPVSGEGTHPIKINSMSNLSATAPLSGSGTIASSSGKNLLPPLQGASGAARSFSTMKNRRHFSTARIQRSGSSPRGRLLALAVAAAAALGVNAVPFQPKKVSIMTSQTDDVHDDNSMSRWEGVFGLRGGDMIQDGGKSSKAPPPLEFAHGTTTLSFVFQGGIVAAVDSRASLGNFVGSKTVQKVLPINTHCLGTMAGGAADCLYWIRKIQAEAWLYEMKNDGKRMSVARSSRLLSNMLFNMRQHELSVGTMIMGYDDDEGPRIFYVDNTGVRLEGDMFSVGSGSTFALGILDQERTYELNEDDAIALGIKAIRHATFRDAYSGGFINVYLITKDGWRKVFSEDLAKSHKTSIVDRQVGSQNSDN